MERIVDGSSVTVIIASHPARMKNGMLDRAVHSVSRQLTQPAEIMIVNDIDASGSDITRNKALAKVTTRWTAFLDSDDEWLPNHLSVLLRNISSNLDVIYTGCRVIDAYGQVMPLQEEWGRFGKEFDPDLLMQKSYIPVTSLVRTKLAQYVGGFTYGPDSEYDDWGLYRNMLIQGAKFKHVPEITWIWHHHGANSSGKPGKGDAK